LFQSDLLIELDGQLDDLRQQFNAEAKKMKENSGLGFFGLINSLTSQQVRNGQVPKSIVHRLKVSYPKNCFRS
jgi:hypothetical protein